MKNNRQSFIKILTSYDKVLIIFILTAAIAIYGVLASNTWKSPDDIVVIRQNGTEILRLTPEKLNEDGVYDFRFGGGTGQIEVKGKKVRMLPMDKAICPQAICSETGWIDGNPKTIICLPNRLIVSFIGDKSSKIDGVTF